MHCESPTAKSSSTQEDNGIGIVVGDVTRFAKTVGETDVYLFAGITGDFSANHVNEQEMQETVAVAEHLLKRISGVFACAYR
jgi:hypothetical protein